MSISADLAEKIQKVGSKIDDVEAALEVLASGGERTGYLGKFSEQELKDRLKDLQQEKNALLQKENELLAIQRLQVEREAARTVQAGSTDFSIDIKAFRGRQISLKFNTQPSLQQIHEGLAPHVPAEFEFIDYLLVGGGIEFSEDSEWDTHITKLASTGTTVHVSLQVKSLCKGFSDFSEPEGKRYLGLDSHQAIPEFDDEFQPSSIGGDVLITGFDGVTVDQVIEHAVVDLYRRLRIYGPIHQAGTEYTRRELITPILLAAALIVSDVNIRAEYGLSGRLGNGPVDYAAVYKEFSVLLTEVVKQEKLVQAIGQALAQIQASREQFARTVLGVKRKYEDNEDLAKVPSTSIVTNGEDYFFIRFMQHPRPAIYKSSLKNVSVGANIPIVLLRQQARELIMLVVGVLEMQKKDVEEKLGAKLPKLDSV